ncbi:hypothetical protein IGI39_004917, partial [Enterococcus sp. AZ135]
EKGKYTPKIGVINDIAEIFRVSISDLMDKDLTQASTTLSLVTKATAKLDESRQTIVLNVARKELAEQEQEKQNNVISMETYKEGRQGEDRGGIGAGVGVNNFYEDITNIEDHEWPLIDIPDDAPYDFDWVYTASGDSMEPVYKDGDIVYAKELDAYERSNIMTDTIYVVRVNGESFLKKFRLTEEAAYLVSLNPKYEDIRLSSDDSVKIVAKVVM